MAKGHLNVIKGTYLESDQVDRTLPMAGGEAANIVRGTIVKPVAGNFTRGLAADSTALNGEYFLALADGTNDAVGHAGGLTGLSLQGNMEIETDQYDGALPLDGPVSIGADGKFVAAVAGDVVLGKVTAAPHMRYSNDTERLDYNGRPAANGGNIQVVRISISAQRAVQA